MKLQKHRFVSSVLPKKAMSRASYGVSADSTKYSVLCASTLLELTF